MNSQSNYRIGENVMLKEKSKRVFISHGSSKDWHQVQTYLEKGLGILTLELAQEPNKGRTVMTKLGEESENVVQL